MRIVFAGTPKFAADHLSALIASESCPHDLVAVYSQPDRPTGRGKKLKPSPVKEVALANDIPVLQPANFKSVESQQQLADLKADLMVVVAYGLLLPEVILQTPRLGCVNVHASLLPRWRGAAPIQRAIEAGDDATGITIMQMDAGLDTGDMLQTVRCQIGPSDTAASIHTRLAQIGIPALIDTINLLAAGSAIAVPQDDSGSCYAAKISKLDAQIDWNQSASSINRKIRAFNPFPTAYTTLGDERLKIWSADLSDHTGQPGTIVDVGKKHLVVACGDGALALRELQLPGGKAMDTAALMNSKADRFKQGTVFVQSEN